MGANAIPLAFQSPQFQSPTDSLTKALSLRELAQRAQMGPEQMRALQLENQQRSLGVQQQQMQLDATKALNQSIQENLKTDPNGGTPTIDYNGVAKSLSTRGWGSKVPGVMADAVERQTKQSQLLKDNLANRRDLLDEATQLLQGVKDDPGYQQVKPRLLQIESQLGFDPGNVPQQYDQGAVARLASQGTKAADFARQTHEAADLAFRQSQGLPKSAKELGDEYNADISTTKSQADLDAKNEKWSALTGADPTGQMGKLFAPIRKATWTPDVPQDAAQSAVPVHERPTFDQKTLQGWSQRLTAAARQGKNQYQAAYNDMPAGLAAYFPGPEKYDPKSYPDLAMKAGATPAEQITAENTAQWRQLTHEDRVERINQGWQRLEDQENKPPTQAQEKDKVSGLVQRVMNDSRAGGGPVAGPEAYTATIRNVQQFYQNDPEIAKYREKIVAQLEDLKQKATRANGKQGQLQFVPGPDGKLIIQRSGQPTAPPTQPAAGSQSPAAAVPSAPPSPTPTQAAATNRKSVQQFTDKGGRTHKPGDPVTLKNGQKVTITQVYDNGTFDYK